MKIQIKLKEGYRLLHNAFISRGVFYRKSLIMLLCIAFFPVVVISIVNYWIGTKQVRDEVTRNHSIQLELIFQNMDRQLNQIAMISGQWGFSPTLTNDLKGTNLTVEYSRFQDIMSGLRIIEGSSSLVHSAALYINTDFGDQLLSNKLGRRVLEDSGEKALYRNYLTSYPSYVWEMTSKFTNNDEIVQQVLMQKIPANLTRPYGLLMIFLSKKGMQEAIGQLPSELGTSFILDGAGDLLINGSHAMQPLPVEERLKKLVIDRGDAQGTFQSQEEKENFLVSYRTLSRNGWRFVIATPLSKLMAPVMFNSLLIVGVSIFILFLTIIASFFAARRIYHPIRNLISMIEGSTANRSMESRNSDPDEIEYIANKWKSISNESVQLKSMLSESRESLKRSFLLQLAQGHLISLSEDEVQEQFRQYWWEPAGRSFHPLLIKLTGIGSYKTSFRKGDGPLISFVAANIVEELLSEQQLESTVINFHDMTLVALLSVPNHISKDEMLSLIKEMTDRIVHKLGEIIRIETTTVIGLQTDRLTQLPRLVEEARQALRYRDLNKKTQILDIAGIESSSYDTKHTYPYSLERSVLEGFRAGDEQSVMMNIDRFIQEVRSTSGKDLLVKQKIMQLLGSVLHLMFKERVSPEALSPGTPFYEELAAMDSPDEITQWFRYTLVAPYMEEIHRQKENDEESKIGAVVEHIHQHYMKPLSLDSCADQVDMTTHKLSVKFKQHTGTNFIDYLTNIRLTKAKELLETTTMTLQDIAEAVGYQLTYFMRIFKKLEGVTPGQYREERRS